MRHLFIVNPVAGKQKLDEKLKKVAKAIDDLPPSLREGQEFETYVTTGPMDACGKIRSAAETCGDLRVYACGGDGTLNECANGAVGLPNVAITHYPCGTGNDFIKTFGADKKRFFDLAELVGGEIRPIDAIDCNGRYSINICSVGIDARVGTDVHKYSGLPVIGGPTGYAVSTIANVMKGISSKMTATAEGLTCGPELNMVCVCNGRYYGGGFNPVPDARPDDGLMDCLIVSGVTRLSFVTAILGYAGGKYRKYPQYITHLRTKELTVCANRTEVINVDGEAEYGEHIVFKMVPQAVRFIFPRDMDLFRGR